MPAMTAALCVLAHATPTPAAVGLLCQLHHNTIGWRLTDILEWWALLPGLLLPGSGDDNQGGNRRGKRIDAPSPIRLDVVAITDLRTGVAMGPGDITGVRGVIHAWARVVVEDRGWDSSQLGTLAQDIGVLQRSADWVAEQAWVDDYAGELDAAYKELRAVVGVPAPAVIAHCTEDVDGHPCGGTLHQDPHGIGVHCTQCGSWWGEHELGLSRWLGAR